ncbi:MAG: ABC transporter permease [Clostridiales bacterium]|jgi:D-methionine transport system permease protein|nr:methionine ABC transporter permease [Bacillota bacterium]NLK02873.1 ABC transporter permease [Clostridiales bacterium]
MFSQAVINMIGKGILETLYMTLLSSLLAYILGLPLGILLVVTDKDGIAPFVILNRILGVIVNIFRSVPFIILLVALMSFTRAIIGTSLGPNALVVPLVIGSAPYIARLVESSLKEVDQGIIEAAQSMGASPLQIVFKVLIPEAMPSLIMGSAIAIITILGYSAMGGFVGAGGLGTIAINYGYYRNQSDIMLLTIAILVLIVQGLQEIGTRLMKLSDRRL